MRSTYADDGHPQSPAAFLCAEAKATMSAAFWALAMLAHVEATISSTTVKVQITKRKPTVRTAPAPRSDLRSASRRDSLNSRRFGSR